MSSKSNMSLVNTNDISVVESQMDFRRPILNDNDLNRRYKMYKLKSDNLVEGGVRHCFKHYKPTGDCALNYFLNRFPIFKWLFKYNIRNDLITDIISGITIGIVHIPQSLAYTMLSHLPTHVGLYVSIFPVLLYVLFGTTRHLSIGTFAIPAIMTASVLYKYEGVLYPAAEHKSAILDALGSGNDSTAVFDYTTISYVINSTGSGSDAHTYVNTADFISNNADEAKIQIGMALAFLTGLLQVVFGILHFGFVTKYLSDAIVTGFTTGAAFHIVLTQIGSLLGFSVTKTKIPFKFVGNCIELFKNIHKTNGAAVIISVISIVLLYLVKEQINHRFEKKMFMPVPIELLVVVFGTLISYLARFQTQFDVKIVGILPKGLPVPQVPMFSLFPKIIGDAISIAIVTFAINISLSKFFGKKYKYEISPNQELFAYGAGNIVTAFFQGYPACASLSRCAILEATNSKSQIYAVISSILVIIVCLFLGPLFNTLPHPCLASIIVVALKNMCLQVLQIPSVYRTSKLEAVAWICTFAGVMILDVDIGLYIGIGLSLIMIIFRTQRPRVTILGNIPGTEIYESVIVCDQAFELNGIKIVRYEESVYYANVDNFKYQVIKCVGVRPQDVQAQIKTIRDEHDKNSKFKETKKKSSNKKSLISCSNNGVNNEAYEMDDNSYAIEMQKEAELIEDQIRSLLCQLPVRHIVLDCSSFNFTDSMGVDAILQLKENYELIGIMVHLSYCKPDLLKLMKKKSFVHRFDFNFIYPTTHDAIHSIVDRCKTLSKDSSIGNMLLNAVDGDAYTNTNFDASSSNIFASQSSRINESLIRVDSKNIKNLSRF